MVLITVVSLSIIVSYIWNTVVCCDVQCVCVADGAVSVVSAQQGGTVARDGGICDITVADGAVVYSAEDGGIIARNGGICDIAVVNGGVVVSSQQGRIVARDGGICDSKVLYAAIVVIYQCTVAVCY